MRRQHSGKCISSLGTLRWVSLWQLGFGLASFDLLVPSHHCRTKPLKHNLSAIVKQTITLPPTTIRPFWSNFKCRKGPPRLDFLGPPSGYDLPRYPPVAWWGVRFLILQSVLFETPYCSMSMTGFNFNLFVEQDVGQVLDLKRLSFYLVT